MNIYKKYPSIENSYRVNTIQRFINTNPKIEDSLFVVYEKLHGANISLVFMDGEFYICSRNRIVGKEENFNDCWNVVKKYPDFIHFYKQASLNMCQKYTFFGEIAGEGIQKGVDYGEKQIYLYDCMIDDKMICQRDFIQWHTTTSRYRDVPPICPIVINGISLEDALNHTNEFDSCVLGKSDNICEGIVIKPLDNVFYYNDSIFMLKSKNEIFEENTQRKKDPVLKFELSDNIVILKLKFKNYINENRVNNVFSKEGIIKDKKEIGKYIKLVLEDAKEDFVKDYDVSGLDNKQNKYVFNCQKLIVEILNKNL